MNRLSWFSWFEDLLFSIKYKDLTGQTDPGAGPSVKKKRGSLQVTTQQPHNSIGAPPNPPSDLPVLFTIVHNCLAKLHAAIPNAMRKSAFSNRIFPLPFHTQPTKSGFYPVFPNLNNFYCVIHTSCTVFESLLTTVKKIDFHGPSPKTTFV